MLHLNKKIWGRSFCMGVGVPKTLVGGSRLWTLVLRGLRVMILHHGLIGGGWGGCHEIISRLALNSLKTREPTN